jgi:hypothetical protein
MRFPPPSQLGANAETDDTFPRFRGKNQVNVPSVPVSECPFDFGTMCHIVLSRGASSFNGAV